MAIQRAADQKDERHPFFFLRVDFPTCCGWGWSGCSGLKVVGVGGGLSGSRALWEGRGGGDDPSSN